jgi:hypothetical protein
MHVINALVTDQFNTGSKLQANQTGNLHAPAAGTSCNTSLVINTGEREKQIVVNDNVDKQRIIRVSNKQISPESIASRRRDE